MIHDLLHEIPVQQYLKGEGSIGATAEDLLPIVQAAGTTEGKAMLEAVAGKQEQIQESIDNEPCHDTEDLRNDIVFLMGMNLMAKWLLALPSNAERIMKTQDGEDRT